MQHYCHLAPAAPAAARRREGGYLAAALRKLTVWHAAKHGSWCPVGVDGWQGKGFKR